MGARAQGRFAAVGGADRSPSACASAPTRRMLSDELEAILLQHSSRGDVGCLRIGDQAAARVSPLDVLDECGDQGGTHAVADPRRIADRVVQADVARFCFDARGVLRIRLAEVPLAPPHRLLALENDQRDRRLTAGDGTCGGPRAPTRSSSRSDTSEPHEAPGGSL